MSFKTVFTTLTDREMLTPTLDNAIAMADAHGAYLEALCLGVDRSNLGYFYEGASAVALQEAIDHSRQDAEAIREATRARLDRSGLGYATAAEVAQLADINRNVAARARFADIAVLPLPYGPGKGSELEAVTEAALFEGQTPVIVVPDGVPLNPRPERVTLAWNESAEALRAIRKALPILRLARSTRIVQVDPPSHGTDRGDPGSQLAQYLARHGVESEVEILSRTLPKVTDVLKRHAVDTGCDLIVMGAYGHSRFRQAILGGATRNMLEEAPVPVFMAH